MTRAECIAELRLRRDACQRTAEIHPCGHARERSLARVGAYQRAIRLLGEDNCTAYVIDRLGGGNMSEYPLELVGQIAEDQTPEQVAELAVEVREHGGVRHVYLLGCWFRAEDPELEVVALRKGLAGLIADDRYNAPARAARGAR